MPSSLADPGDADRVPVVRVHRAGQGREHGEAADPADALHLEADALRRHLQLGTAARPIRPPTADGRLLRLRVAPNGGLRIVYNDTTNEFDGAGLFVTRQIAGSDGPGRRTSTSSPPADPVADVTGDAQYPHYSQAGVGPNLPQLDLTSLKVSNPTPTTLRLTMTVTDASQFAAASGQDRLLSGSCASRRSGRWPPSRRTSTTSYYASMEKTAGELPKFSAGSPSAIDTSANDCKVLQYGGDTTATGRRWNTITIDVGVNTGFGVPIDD